LLQKRNIENVSKLQFIFALSRLFFKKKKNHIVTQTTCWTTEESQFISGGVKVFFLFLAATRPLLGLSNLIFRNYSKDQW